MRKIASTHWWNLAAVCCCMLLSVAPSRGAESEASNATLKIENVGFMKNPPQELVDRFPMCDAFLKVEWIDEDKKVGYGNYGLYSPCGEQIISEITALVHLGEPSNRYDYAIQSFRDNIEKWSVYKDVTQEEFERLSCYIKENDFRLVKASVPTIGGLEFCHLSSYLVEFTDYRDPYEYTLSAYSQNVCVPYPDMQRVWLAEGKSVKNDYSNDKIQMLINVMKESKIGNKIADRIMDSTAVDINFDGKDDFIDVHWGWAVYSKDKVYIESIESWSGDVDKSYGEWIFPPASQTCKTNMLQGTYWTTDGSSYFLHNKCNVTKLINR